MSALLKFLQRNTVQAATPSLPYVHSTQAYHLKKIWRTETIEARPCEVFVNENLNYFFVGRPAYKRFHVTQQSEFWELPVCFIVNFASVTDVRRIFPFDSGAFKAKRFPEYINMMDIDEFEVSSDPGAPTKIVGAFFGSHSDYFNLVAKAPDRFSSEFPLGPFDEEIHA